MFWRNRRAAGTNQVISDVTRILEAARLGDPKAADELLPLVYEELRKLAAAKMAKEAAGNTLQPTAVVHEAWLRLAGHQNQEWDGRAHFFAAAAEAMRRILIDCDDGSKVIELRAAGRLGKSAAGLRSPVCGREGQVEADDLRKVIGCSVVIGQPPPRLVCWARHPSKP